tara:strand:- start:24 stop:1334 length:1311 start_codon:yes stop_codon:yes gene_type:complete
LKFNLKQQHALSYLADNETTQVLFGGGAGGGKSLLGSHWIIKNCIKYTGTRWLMGRSKLATLKTTTLKTFFEVCLMHDITTASYNYNAQSNVITFFNGSEIILKDLFSYPSDPNFDSLGSLEITGAFIDECNQISQKAKNIVMSRIRFKLDEFDLMPKVLMTCNPAKNWVYSEFYQPDRNNTLSNDKKFVQALVGDNPFISRFYASNLSKLDKLSKARLLHGDWEYSSDLALLFNQDGINDMFNNSEHVDEGVNYITADIARFGQDKTVIGLWSGLRLEKMIVMDKSTLVQVRVEIELLCMQHKIPMEKVLCDSDGVGAGAVDELGCNAFVNNGKALNGENFANLKSQCYFKLADYVNKGKLFVNCPSIDIKNDIIQELEVVRVKDPDLDNRKAVEGKDKVKEKIGRSPDFSDMMMMRMWFIIYGGVSMSDRFNDE